MKTLVIHPKDPTTEFLSVIYKGRGYTEIRHIMNKNDLLKQIKSHDRIIMLGHGSPNGLIGYIYFFRLNESLIKVLQTKDCVCIWCHADEYVHKNNLKGFYTGMFISEVAEAEYYGIQTTQEEIDYSNNLFADIIKTHLNSPKILTETKRLYVAENSPIIDFNNQRLYYRDEENTLTTDDFNDKFLIN